VIAYSHYAPQKPQRTTNIGIDMNTFDRIRLAAPLAALALFASTAACASNETTEKPKKPAKENVEGLSFVVLGDWGWNGQGNQREIAARIDAMSKELDPEFFVSVGDNFQVSGVRSTQDPLWKRSYEDIYTAVVFEKDWYVVLGNHDYRGNTQAQIDYTKISRRWNMPSRYYVVNQTTESGISVDLFFIDTSPLQRKYWTETGKYPDVSKQDTTAQLRWLDSALAASKAQWKLVFGHHPVYSGGRHARDLLDQPTRFGTRFEKGGVNAYFSGHDHHLEHIRQPGGKVDYFIAGAHNIRPVTPTPASLFAKSVPGFMSVKVRKDSLIVTSTDVDGNTVDRAAIAPRK